MKLKGIILVVLVVIAQSGYAQQDAMFTQYMFNGLVLNPAYAGSHEALSATALLRKQWVNVDGAPSTQTLSMHTPYEAKRMGFGLQLVHDKIGVSNETNIYGSYSYWVPMGNGRLSMGLQAGVNMLRSEFDELVLINEGDPGFDDASFSAVKPNFGAGLYYYTDRFYVGLSAPRLLRNNYGQLPSSVSTNDFSFRQERHYYLTAGYLFELSPNVKLKPSFLVKQVSNAPVEVDLNANVLFVDRLWLGVSLRSGDSFDFLAQFLVNNQLSIGYAYDLTTSSLKSQTSGSHEVMVNYLFSFGDKKILTPRYF